VGWGEAICSVGFVRKLIYIMTLSPETETLPFSEKDKKLCNSKGIVMLSSEHVTLLCNFVHHAVRFLPPRLTPNYICLRIPQFFSQGQHMKFGLHVKTNASYSI
jgi:hypothetical protein